MTFRSLDVWIYIFLCAMTTLSAVIFLYSSETKLASIAVIHIDETGRVASAAAAIPGTKVRM